MPGSVITVRFNLDASRRELADAVRLVEAGDPEEAYKAALRGRNGLFHARRAWSELVGLEPPQMPVTGASHGHVEGHRQVARALEAALGFEGDDEVDVARRMEPSLREAEEGYRQLLGYLRDEVGRRMRR